MNGDTQVADSSDQPASSGQRPIVFIDLYREHSRSIFTYLYQQTMCPEIAADLTAETFAQALEHFGRWDPSRGTPNQWLFGIAHNLFRMWARSGATATRARERLAFQTPRFSYADLERIEADLASTLPEIRDAFDALSPADQEVVRLRVFEHCDYPDIARRLGCGEGAARTRVSRALAKLRSLLSESIPDVYERLA